MTQNDRIEKAANSAVLLLFSRLGTGIGVPLCVAALIWMVGTIQEVTRNMAVVAAQIQYLQESDAAIARRVERLENRALRPYPGG
jgi:ABC-type lipoprotein release transport system permease subunit